MNEKKHAFPRRKFLIGGSAAAGVAGLAYATGGVDYLIESLTREPDYKKVSITDILDNPEGYDGQHVEFSGKPTLVRYKIDSELHIPDPEFHLVLVDNEGRHIEPRITRVAWYRDNTCEKAEREISSLIEEGKEVTVKGVASVIAHGNDGRTILEPDIYLTSVMFAGREFQLGKKYPTGLTDFQPFVHHHKG